MSSWQKHTHNKYRFANNKLVITQLVRQNDTRWLMRVFVSLPHSLTRLSRVCVQSCMLWRIKTFISSLTCRDEKLEDQMKVMLVSWFTFLMFFWFFMLFFFIYIKPINEKKTYEENRVRDFQEGKIEFAVCHNFAFVLTIWLNLSNVKHWIEADSPFLDRSRNSNFYKKKVRVYCFYSISLESVWLLFLFHFAVISILNYKIN